MGVAPLFYCLHCVNKPHQARKEKHELYNFVNVCDPSFYAYRMQLARQRLVTRGHLLAGQLVQRHIHTTIICCTVIKNRLNTAEMRMMANCAERLPLACCRKSTDPADDND